MKQILKRLAADIDEVLYQNNLANEMGAMIDAGEWSQSGPNFSSLVERWKLTRQTLELHIDEAIYYRDMFYMHFPIRGRDWKFDRSKAPWDQHTPESVNPWHNIVDLLHCIFMADSL